MTATPQALLELLAVVVRGGLLDLGADLLDPALDVGLVAGTIDDRRVLLAGRDLLGSAEIVERCAFQGQAHFLGDHRAACQDRDVLQHGLAAVAEARCLGGGDLHDAAHVVDHQRRERFTLDVLGDHHQRPTGLGDVLEDRQHVADVGDLLVAQQDVGFVQFGGHGVLVVDEVGRQVAAVELHAFDDFKLVLEPAALLDGDDAFLANLVHGVGDHVADLRVVVGGNRADLGDGRGVLAGGRHLLEFTDGCDHGLVDAAFQVHRVHPGGHRL